MPAPPTSTMMSAPRPPVSFSASLSQSGVGLIVDHGLGAHLLQPLGLGRRARGGDHARAEHPGELQGEDRDAAGALHQHRVAGLELPISTSACQAVTAAQGSVAPSSKLRPAGSIDDAVLFQHGQLGQHAVDRAAHRRGLRRLVDGAAEPFLHEAAGDPVADLDAADAGPDRDHFAGAVRQRDQVGLGRGAGVLRLDREQVAVVERRGAHPHQHLAAGRASDRAARPG